MKKISIINGPNLGLLGKREVSIYGNKSLKDMEDRLTFLAKDRASLDFFQSDVEGEIVSYIGRVGFDRDALIINPGAYTHTSIAIRDAFLAIKKPFLEVHLSNVYARESFRHKSYLKDIASGVIVGLGLFSYEYALLYCLDGLPNVG